MQDHEICITHLSSKCSPLSYLLRNFLIVLSSPQKLRCFLDDKSHKPVTLTLTGSCTGIPPVKEVQNFQAVVRQSDTKQLSISNKTNQLWVLKPIIDGEYWSGPVTFNVEPQQTKGYELTYFPLTMTSENKKHMVSKGFLVINFYFQQFKVIFMSYLIFLPHQVP